MGDFVKCSNCNDLGYTTILTDNQKQIALRCLNCDSEGYFKYIKNKYGKTNFITNEDYSALIGMEVKNPRSKKIIFGSLSNIEDIQKFIHENNEQEVRCLALLKREN
jgi:hypothetical protein